MLALLKNDKAEIFGKELAEIKQFPIPPEPEKNHRPSTTMDCLYTRDEILAVYEVFHKRVEYAATLTKEKIARRNLTMFVCAINIGLRGGDFCSLKWSDIFESNWTYKQNADFFGLAKGGEDRIGNNS